MLKTLTRPPEPNSFRGWVLIFYQQKLEEIDQAKTRAIIQAAINEEAASDAFELYLKIAYPGLEDLRKKEKDKIKTLMEEEMSKKLIVTPDQVPTFKSQLRKKL